MQNVERETHDDFHTTQQMASVNKKNTQMFTRLHNNKRCFFGMLTLYSSIP